MASALTSSMISDSACISLHLFAKAHVGNRDDEEGDGEYYKNQVVHSHTPIQGRTVESNVTTTATANRFCVGVSPTTAGATNDPRKNPPCGPRESSMRCSSRTIPVTCLLGIRYSSVVVF